MTAIDALNETPVPRWRWRRLSVQILLLGMRACVTGAKFLLAIYTARYLGLADLGVYGLLVGGVTIMPALAGLGMTDWTMRRIVDLPSSEALPLIATRLGLTLCIHLIVQPLTFVADIALGEPIPLRLAFLCGAILLLENLGTEAADMLIARKRVMLAYTLNFLRMGVWPIPVMAAGLLFPQTRTLDALLLGWIAMLILSWIILFGLVVTSDRWRHLRPQWSFLREALPHSIVLYVKDVSGTVNAFADRFLISLFLGLELTGVYTLFWSIANVVHMVALFGVVQPQLARLYAAGQSTDRGEFRSIERRLQIETGAWALLLAAGAVIATPFLIPYLGRPLLEAYLPVFWLILAATLIRVAADGYGFILLALHRDRAIATIAVIGALASAVMNVVLTPVAGLWGAAATFAITAGGLFAARFWLSRQA
jgi:O-antigen/teichoic acid export membrane protein